MCLTWRSVQQKAESHTEVNGITESGQCPLCSQTHCLPQWDGVGWMQKQSLPNTVIALPPPLPHSSLTLNSASTYFLNPLSVLLFSSSTYTVVVVWSSSPYKLWWVLWNLRSPSLKLGPIHPWQRQLLITLSTWCELVHNYVLIIGWVVFLFFIFLVNVYKVHSVVLCGVIWGHCHTAHTCSVLC